jgi:uncharacterized RDD family membrane protein YckC
MDARQIPEPPRDLARYSGDAILSADQAHDAADSAAGRAPDDVAPRPVPHLAAAYATFGGRLRALVIDAAVFSLVVGATVLAADLTPNIPGTGRVAVAVLLSWAVLYEPLMVWRFGWTVGHRLTNLRVVADDSRGRPSLARAFARYWIKGVLGLLSFLTMAATRRHQAVHDLLTGTTVQLRDRSKAGPGDFVTEASDIPPLGMPSPLRRAAVILLYVVGTYLVLTIVAAGVVSAECVMEDRCTSAENQLFGVLGACWIATAIGCLVAGWRGRLWGCRVR